MIPRKTPPAEALWNVTLLPLPPRAARRPFDPGPEGGGSALARAALLSTSDDTPEGAVRVLAA